MSKVIKGEFKHNNKTIYYNVVQEKSNMLDVHNKQLVAYYSTFKYSHNILRHRIVLLSCSYLGYLATELKFLDRVEELMTYDEYCSLYDEQALNLNKDEIQYIARRQILTELNPTES